MASIVLSKYILFMKRMNANQLCNLCVYWDFVCVCVAQGPDEDLSLAVCLEGRRRLTLKALRRDDGAEPVTLTAVTLGIANHSLIFRARGCADDLWEVEVREPQPIVND